MPMPPVPRKNPGYWVSKKLTWSQPGAGEIKPSLCSFTGKGPLGVCVSFPPGFTPFNMSLCQFCFEHFFFSFFFFIVVGFVVHWNETAMGLHVFALRTVVGPESPTSKLLKLGMVLELLTHDPSYLRGLTSLHSCPFSLCFFLFLEQFKFFPAPGPLHILPHLPGMLFPVSS